MSEPTWDLSLVWFITVAFFGNKKASSTLEATNLLKAIMICINWQDIQIARRSRIGSLVKKNISFLVPILKEYRRNK